MVSQRLSCLLIDDDKDDQEIFCMAMEDIGEQIECIFESDGIEAIQNLNDRKYLPDYIFIDMNMPKMNGNDCLREIRKLSHLKDVPVYMYSTFADPEDVDKTKQLGASGFIVKPASIAELTDTLRFCLK